MDTDGQSHDCPDCVGGYRDETCQYCSDGYIDCGECNGRGYFDSDGWIESYLDDFWNAFSKRMGDTCIEFRLFDSCFEKPEYIIRYLELINKALRYYSDRPRRFVKLNDGISLKKRAPWCSVWE